MAKKYTLILILAVVLGLAAFVLFYRQTDGFQDGGTDPSLIKIFANLLETYNMVLGKVTALGIQSRPIEGTTLENYLRDQLATLQKLGESCSTTVCTEEQIKDPSFLTAYNKANTVGELGLPDISFETLAVDSPDASGGAAGQQPDGAPDTQLPPAQMPASVIAGSKPSLDDCKKHYTCNISANMA